jgi:hypothetical protein
LQDIGIHFASFSSENLFFDFFILNRDEEKCKSETSDKGKVQTENSQVEDKKKKPDSICTGTGKEIKN